MKKIIGILICYVAFRLLFAYYGYIATEEGTLLYNQRLAYSGLLPFIDYDAWNSLFHDYLVGWFHFFADATIINQRVLGIGFAIGVFILTLRLSSQFKSESIMLWTAIFLTFGSWTYLYLSTIPYSEQTMTLFLLLSLAILPADGEKGSYSVRRLASASIATFATLLRSQALFASLSIVFYLLLTEKTPKNKLFLALLSLGTIVLALSPFFIAGTEQTIYSFTWPFFADQILVYQIGAQATYSSYMLYLQEAFRDYGILLALFFGGIVTVICTVNKQRLGSLNKIILIMILSVAVVLPGLVHKPPYASYIYPSVPFLAIVAAWTLVNISQKLKNNYVLYAIISALLVQQFILFPHYKFLKTSIKTIHSTPHDELDKIVQDVKKNSSKDDIILSFYSPIPLLADRTIETGFNRDRFSLSILSTDLAKKHHLVSNEMLQEGFTKKRYKMVILTDDIENRFIVQNNSFHKTLEILHNHYDLWKVYDSLAMIESPKPNKLRIYKPKINSEYE